MTINILNHIVSIAVLSAYLAYIYRFTIRTELMNYYITVHFFAILSLVLDFLALLAQETGARHFFTILSSAGGILFSISLLCFGLVLLRGKGLSLRFLTIAYILPVISLIWALLTEQSLMLEQVPGMPKPGALYKVNSGIEYFLRFAACIALAAAVARRRKKSLFELFLVAVALASSTLRIMVSFSQPAYMSAVGPLVALMVFSLLFFGSAKLGMHNIMSLGIKRSLELYDEAVFIMDNKGKLVYMNPACEKLDRDVFQAVFDACRSEVQRLSDIDQDGSMLDVAHDRGLYTISIRPAKTVLHRRSGFICVIHDDTGLKTAIRRLKQKNEELVALNNSIRQLRDQTSHLAAIEERNSLAQEIHDVMGHSLNLALHTLESNLLIVDTDPEKAVMRLKQVISDIDRGMEEIAAHTESREYRSPLWPLLAQMADRLSEIGVRMEVVHPERVEELNDEMIKTIYRICQEAATNAIKHGKADQITVSIKEKEGSLHIYIIDNGKGCKKIIKGNGLKGMEERIHKLGGKVYFNGFEDGNGFIVRATVPLGIETAPVCQ